MSRWSIQRDQRIHAAYVDALSRVADVDIDHTDEQVVYRERLDHAGMSGGGVNVDWWRTKGIPLLVDRAADRRPPTPSPATKAPPSSVSRPRPAVGQMIRGVAVWAIILAIPVALIGGGGSLLYQRAIGTRVDATVLECDTSGAIIRGASTYRTDCIAEWSIDGRAMIGTFTGGNGESDVCRTVDATVRGDTAYSRSLGLPVLLLALSLPFLAVPVLAIRSRLRNRPTNATAQ